MGKFQETIKRIRVEKGFKTAKSFSTALGIPYTSYMNYENKDREPPYEILCRMADILCVTTDELLTHNIDKYQKMYSYLSNMGFITQKQHGAISVGYLIEKDSHGAIGEAWWLYQTEEGLYQAVRKAKEVMREETRATCKRILKEQFSNDGLKELKKIHPELSSVIDKLSDDSFKKALSIAERNADNE